MITIHENYILARKLDLDLQTIKGSCNVVYPIIMEAFGNDEKTYDPMSSPSTRIFQSYNLLLYPVPGLWDLYNSIKAMFRDIVPNRHPHYIHAWLNMYQKGEYIGWHSHYGPDKNSYHGIYCVNTEPSKTTYRISGAPDIDIINEDNLLVISKSNGETHRTWPWGQREPRITVAFDILPADHINPKWPLNHWIPI